MPLEHCAVELTSFQGNFESRGRKVHNFCACVGRLSLSSALGRTLPDLGKQRGRNAGGTQTCPPAPESKISMVGLKNGRHDRLIHTPLGMRYS
jgi:hypothetical protein